MRGVRRAALVALFVFCVVAIARDAVTAMSLVVFAGAGVKSDRSRRSRSGLALGGRSGRAAAARACAPAERAPAMERAAAIRDIRRGGGLRPVPAAARSARVRAVPAARCLCKEALLRRGRGSQAGRYTAREPGLWREAPYPGTRRSRRLLPRTYR